jgi:tetratricopeptide (TPR) repeat protein
MKSQSTVIGVVGALGLCAMGAFARADQQPQPPQAPKNVNVESTTPKAAALTSRAASAEMNGDPQQALKLADRAIAANPRDPWAFYDRAMALSRVGQMDKALEAFSAAEVRYAANDRWGKSVAIYGRAHALSEARRCDEAKQAFNAYASLIREQDPKSANTAMRYAADCRSPATAPVAAQR